jgi:hypothetical protein
MFISKKHLSRRMVLRGLGTTVALPLLESMIPAATALAQTAAVATPRFTAVFSAHGWAPTYWHDGWDTGFAPTEGRNVGLGFIHQPLAAFQDRLSIFAGLDATASMPPPGTSGGDHARAAASLTGAMPKKTSGADIHCGTSVDQLIAQRYGQDTLLPSLQLGLEDPGANTGVCGWGYSCAYTNSVSWASPTQPLPHEVNPQVVFERLFGDGGTAEERLQRRMTNASILDYITGSVADLKKNLPGADRHSLDAYLESVREVERRVKIGASRSADAPDMEVPFGAPQAMDDYIKLMWDMQVLAFQADITRVTSLLYARDESGTTYPESGIMTANHAASHHGEDPKRREDFAKINRYQMQTLGYFLKRLQETPDGDSNLLENSLVLWTSNMGNANQHNHTNVGQMLAGGAMGRHRPQKLNILDKGPTSNLLLSVLHLYDIQQDSIGDSTRAVSLS